MKRKLGLKPVKEQPRVRLSDYYTSDLPSADSLKFPYGHTNAIKPEMFLNQILGDCAWAGSIEEVRLANALRGVTVNFTDKVVVENYESTGYKPGPEIEGFNADGSAILNLEAPENPTDGGTDVHDLYDYRKNTGIIDADGNAHKIIAYAGLTPGNFDELLVALSIFDMVGIGISVPDYAESQFEAGQPWHLVPGRHSIVGGHYISVCGAVDRNTAQLYTWGAVQNITSPFYNAFNTVAVVALTEELFNNDKTPEGLDLAKLQADLPQFNTGPVMAKAPKRRKSATAPEPLETPAPEADPAPDAAEAVA